MSRTGSVPKKKPGGRWAVRPAEETYWMKRWVDAAAKAQSVEDVNIAAGINMFDYHHGRLDDPGFDAAALVFDQILDQLVLFSVRNAAIKGDGKAQVLYYGKVRVPAFVPGFPSWRAAEAEAEAKQVRAEEAKAQARAKARAKPRDDEDGDPPAMDAAVAEAMVAAAVKAAEAAARVNDPAPPSRRHRRFNPPAPRPE